MFLFLIVRNFDVIRIRKKHLFNTLMFYMFLDKNNKYLVTLYATVFVELRAIIGMNLNLTIEI